MEDLKTLFGEIDRIGAKYQSEAEKEEFKRQLAALNEEILGCHGKGKSTLQSAIAACGKDEGIPVDQLPEIPKATGSRWGDMITFLEK